MGGWRGLQKREGRGGAVSSSKCHPTERTLPVGKADGATAVAGRSEVNPQALALPSTQCMSSGLGPQGWRQTHFPVETSHQHFSLLYFFTFLFKKLSYLLSTALCLHVSAYVHAVLAVARWGRWFPGAGVTEGCEPHVGAGNRTGSSARAADAVTPEPSLPLLFL